MARTSSILPRLTDSNLNQIFEAASGDGYLIAQAYIPEAKAGDVRLFLMNGLPLVRDGSYAAFRRVPAKGDVRSNIHAAGTARKVKVTDTMLAHRRDGAPKLVERRHVSGRARHRRRQTSGDQRLHARRAGTARRPCTRRILPQVSLLRWRRSWRCAKPMERPCRIRGWRRFELADTSPADYEFPEKSLDKGPISPDLGCCRDFAISATRRACFTRYFGVSILINNAKILRLRSNSCFHEAFCGQSST